MIVLSLYRWKLTARIHTLTQMLYNSVVAILSRHCLDIGYKMCVTIFKLACSRNQYHTLKVQATLIPTRTLLHKTVENIVIHLSRYGSRTNSFLILEILHIGSSSLDNNKINAGTYLITLRITNITCCIFPNIGFQIGINTNLRNTF